MGRNRLCLSPEKRLKRLNEQKRQSGRTKIYLLQAFPVWEKAKNSWQKLRNLPTYGSSAQFILHLLATHEASCNECKSCVTVDGQFQMNSLEENLCYPTNGNEESCSDYNFLEKDLCNQDTPCEASSSNGNILTSTPRSNQQHQVSHADLRIRCRLENNFTFVEEQLNSRLNETLVASSLQSNQNRVSQGEAELHCRVENNLEVNVDVENLDTSLNETFATIGSNPNTDDIEDLPGNESHHNVDGPAKFCIVAIETIMTLVRKCVGENCSCCHQQYLYQPHIRGSVFTVKWDCPCPKAGGSWSTDQSENGKNMNLRLVAAMVYSGCEFLKMQHFAQLFNLAFISRTTDCLYKKVRCYPSIMRMWSMEQVALLTSASIDALEVAADGRCDSPGFSAQCSTYTVMDLKTNKVLHIEFADKRHTEKCSPQMELHCFRNAVNFLESHCHGGIKEVVTDSHKSIEKYMAQNHSAIQHQKDVWHASKNLMKRISKASKYKEKQVLSVWASAVGNHFWWCAQNCDGNEQKMIKYWISILHHVQDRHHWPSGKCFHHDLLEDERQKPWLPANSPAFAALRIIVMDQAFLAQFKFYVNFRHTGLLENFQSLITKYCPKRNFYPYETYCCLNTLAALDHNDSVNRPNAGHVPQYNIKFNKNSQRWTAQAKKKEKQKRFSHDLMKLALSGEHVGTLSEYFPDNPKNISPNSARVARPPTTDIIASQHSRFKRQKLN